MKQEKNGRKNLFGIPESIQTNSFENRSHLCIDSDISDHIEQNTNVEQDINETIISLFSNKDLKMICQNENLNQFIAFLIQKGLLKTRPIDDGLSRGWYTSNAYVAVEIVVMYGVSIAAFAAAIGVVMGRPEDNPEIENSILLQKNLKNPFLKIFSLLAFRLGKESFGKRVHELFYNIENGRQQIFLKENEVIIDGYC